MFIELQTSGEFRSELEFYFTSRFIIVQLQIAIRCPKTGKIWRNEVEKSKSKI